jgi:tRNA threonylcarbamoyladenosine biosynthesis protein TsaE
MKPDKRQPGVPNDAVRVRQETFETRSPRGTLALGKRLAGRFRAGDCVGLEGGLGAGKTLLVRGIATGLEVEDPRLVSSPTYVLVQEYPCRVPLYHIDVYRMSEPDAELADLGLQEMLEDGIVLLEWADRAASALPRPRWNIRIEPIAETARRLTLTRIS